MQEAISLSSAEWHRLEREAGRHPVPEDADMQEYLRRLELGSKKMTSTWTNTVEYIQARDKEIEEKKKLKHMQSAERFYSNYLKNEKLKRQQVIESASEVVFQNKHATRQLTRAAIKAASLKEQELQRQFQKHLQEERRKKVEKENKIMMEEVRKWQQYQKQKKILRLQKDIEHQQYLIEQINQRKKLNELRMAEEKRLEAEDLEKATKELKDIEKFENELIAATKDRIRRDTQLQMHETEHLKFRNRLKDQLDYELNELVRTSDQRICDRIKATKQARTAKREEFTLALSEKIFTGEDAKAKRQQETLEKVQRMMEEKRAAREEKEIEIRKQARRERIEERARYLKTQIEQEKKERHLRSWSMMNRFKNMELVSEYKRRQQEDAWRRKMEWREELLKMKKEREDREADDRKTLERMYQKEQAAIKYFDERLVRHGRNLYKEAKENEWPTYPIVKSMKEYYSQQRLWPMPPLPKPLQDIFPKYKPSDPPPDITKPESGDSMPEDVGTSSIVKDSVPEKLPALFVKRNGLEPKVKNFPVGSTEHSEEESMQHSQYRALEHCQVDSPQPFRTESSNCEMIQQMQVESLQGSNQTTENINNNKHTNKKRNLAQDPLEDEELSFMKKSTEPPDEHIIFGQLVAEKIRKLSKMNQAVAHYRINSVLFELEMEELNTAPVT